MTQSAPQTGITLTMSKTINAPRERGFAAWIQPESLRNWSGAHESFSAPVAEVALRVGGRYRLGMLEPGKDAPYVCYSFSGGGPPGETGLHLGLGEDVWRRLKFCARRNPGHSGVSR